MNKAKIAILGALGFAVVTAIAPAASAETASPSAGTGKHCRTVLAKLRPGETSSRVISHTCSDRKADLRINDGTLITTWYEHAEYQGASNAIEGDGGPCDSVGYGIRDTGLWSGWWRYIISSYKVWNNCGSSGIFTNTDYGGESDYNYSNQPTVPASHNDHIYSMLLWN